MLKPPFLHKLSCNSSHRTYIGALCCECLSANANNTAMWQTGPRKLKYCFLYQVKNKNNGTRSCGSERGFKIMCSSLPQLQLQYLPVCFHIFLQLAPWRTLCCSERKLLSIHVQSLSLVINEDNGTNNYTIKRICFSSLSKSPSKFKITTYGFCTHLYYLAGKKLLG